MVQRHEPVIRHPKELGRCDREEDRRIDRIEVRFVTEKRERPATVCRSGGCHADEEVAVCCIHRLRAPSDLNDALDSPGARINLGQCSVKLIRDPQQGIRDRKVGRSVTDRNRVRDDVSGRVYARDRAVEAVGDPHRPTARRDRGRSSADRDRLDGLPARCNAKDAVVCLAADPDRSTGGHEVGRAEAEGDRLDDGSRHWCDAREAVPNRVGDPHRVPADGESRGATSNRNRLNDLVRGGVDPRDGPRKVVRHPDRSVPDGDPARTCADRNRLAGRLGDRIDAGGGVGVRACDPDRSPTRCRRRRLRPESNRVREEAVCIEPEDGDRAGGTDRGRSGWLVVSNNVHRRDQSDPTQKRTRAERYSAPGPSRPWCRRRCELRADSVRLRTRNIE